MGKSRLPENSAWLITSLIAVRFVSVFVNLIYDCDETYNYWEVGHYLLYRNGFLTWEYSPKYALRSYFYIWSYMWPSYLISTIYSSVSKVFLFYFTRLLIASLGVFSELYFCIGLNRCAGSSAARYALAFLTMSGGMFMASTGFLPSTFSMHMTMIAFGSWFAEHYKLFIFSSGLSILVGWPYAAIAYLPMAATLLVSSRRKLLFFILLTAIYGTMIIVPLVLIDSYHYGRFVIAPLNTVVYNVFSSEAGPTLYGVESALYYPLNLTLNFNIIFWLSLTSFPLMIVSYLFLTTRKHKNFYSTHLICAITMLLWLIAFSLQAHKEERFMYPIYPLICASAALTVKIIEQLVVGVKHPKSAPVFKTIVLICCVLYMALSFSRLLALTHGYNSTFNVFSDLRQLDSIKSPDQKIIYDAAANDDNNNVINVCMGKEWYRYPSSFFLPSSNHYRLRFIRSEFSGQLPKPYDSTNRNSVLETHIVPSDMNYLNKEELSRYIDVFRCHYLIDSNNQNETTEFEPNYSSDTANWHIAAAHPILVPHKSPPLFRSFYVPFISSLENYYTDFYLLRNKRLFTPSP
ncbi:Alpha-1,2-mannosyltransferase ALG9 [Fragariocoptes setiger]|uniref:Mannosyltransferase n=1 Tax=Fragariocoptes setiger TaxID=1670756 RepID=A0ABQ7S604_9ACAR|nr:Alpha-1,2-mannosyltransferase ALG9 [Fragariocoptes setiger]